MFGKIKMRNKVNYFTKTDNMINCMSVGFITILLSIGYSKTHPMDSNLLTIIATLSSGILASVSTVWLTDRKEKKAYKKRMLQTKDALFKLLNNNYLHIIKLEVLEYKEYYSLLMNNQYPNIILSDRKILSIDVFEIIKEREVIEMCMFYNLPIDLFFGVLKTYSQLYDVAINKIDIYIKDELNNIGVKPITLPDNSFRQEDTLQRFLQYQKTIMRENIATFEMYIKDTEDLIDFLKQV